MKLLIVENEGIVAEDLADIIVELGHELVGIAASQEEAIAFIHNADAVLLDIRIDGNSSGIDFAKKLNTTYHIPFIFISAHSDKRTVEEASILAPFAYLVKPIRKEHLFTSLELLKAHLNVKHDQAPKFKFKENGLWKEILVENISHLKADGNYTIIVHLDQEILITKNLKSLLLEDTFKQFERVHKSFTVNPSHIVGKSAKEIRLANHVIPIGRAFKD